MKATIIALSISGSLASAKIGADFHNCSKLYGAAVEGDDSQERAVFAKGGIRVTCWFDNGKCSSVNYEVRTPGFVVEWTPKDNRFNESQSKALLSMNGEGWQLQKPSEFGAEFDGIYKSGDGALQAYVGSTGVAVETLSWFNKRSSSISPSQIDKTISELKEK